LLAFQEENQHFTPECYHLVSTLFIEGNSQNFVDSIAIIFDILFVAIFYFSLFKIVNFVLSIFAIEIIDLFTIRN
jgi:hypothetical protein